MLYQENMAQPYQFALCKVTILKAGRGEVTPRLSLCCNCIRAVSNAFSTTRHQRFIKRISDAQWAATPHQHSRHQKAHLFCPLPLSFCTLSFLLPCSFVSRTMPFPDPCFGGVQKKGSHNRLMALQLLPEKMSSEGPRLRTYPWLSLNGIKESSTLKK